MTAVPEKVLNWLYSVLTSEYHDVNRTFSDVSQTLAEYPSLSPRTEVYTYENGASALLLRLSGNLPVGFRGTIYKFPILLWVPHGYPHESPIIYVSPSEGLAVRPGQHVSVEGRVYHPYLAQWTQFRDRISLASFLRVLQDVFSKEPPVRSVQQERYEPPQTQHGSQASSYPQTPAEPANVSRESPRAPPPPPKPYEQQTNGSRPLGEGQQRQSGEPTLPPLPPKQPSRTNEQHSGRPLEYISRGQQEASYNGYHYEHHEPPSSAGAPPPPPKPFQQQQHQTPTPSLSESARFSRYEQPAPLPPQAQSVGGQRPPQGPPPGAPPPQQYPNYPPSQTPQYPPPQQRGLYQTQQQVPAPQPPKPAQPAPDLLTSTLDLPLPSSQPDPTLLSAPPIPPNPEKDALLHALSQTLHSHLTHTLAQNHAAIPPLQAQQSALRAAYATLAAELHQLQDLDAALARNERILAEGMRDADRVMREARERPVPGVDEVLVAPTVVGNQLWGLCAEEVGIAEAMYALGRGLDAGRVGAEAFVKQTRALARERFLKKALIKKIARGMGLDMNNS